MTDDTPGGAGIHSTAVIYGESGVLILGPSRSGKSALALALLDRARSTGRFGALVGDDRVWVRAVAGRLVASGAPRLAGMVERRMCGLRTAPVESAALIALAAEINRPGEAWPRWPPETNDVVIDGVPLPRVALHAGQSASDQALTIDEQLAGLAPGRMNGGRFSLEHCAAVHKNKKLTALLPD
jgi:serine kinase of HPr protein (carbohydrate metabolism regulator)